MNEKVITSDVLNQYGSEIKDYIDSQVLYNTTAYWNQQTTFIPSAKTIIVYTDYKTIIVSNVQKQVPGIKIADGHAYVVDLPFVDEAISIQLMNHINNREVHIQEGERAFWNNKLNYTLDEFNGILEFNRN